MCASLDHISYLLTRTLQFISIVENDSFSRHCQVTKYVI